MTAPSPTPARTPHTSPGRRALGLMAGNRISQVYLLVVLALLVWTAVDSTLVQQQDASFAGVFPMLATLPWGLAVALLPDGSTLGFFAVVIAGALINATLIGLIVRHARD